MVTKVVVGLGADLRCEIGQRLLRAEAVWKRAGRCFLRLVGQAARFQQPQTPLCAGGDPPSLCRQCWDT